MRTEQIDREELINKIWETRGKVALVAEHFKVSTVTIYNYCDKYVTVKNALETAQKHAKMLLVDTAESKLQQAVILGQRWAVTQVLNNYEESASRGWGNRQRNEISGIDGKPISLDANHSGKVEVEQSVSTETVSGVLGILREIHAFANVAEIDGDQDNAGEMVS